MKKTIYLIEFLALFLYACGTPKIATSTVDLSSVDTLTIIDPLTEIYLIKKGGGNRRTLDYELSKIAEDNIRQGALELLSTRFSVKPYYLDSLDRIDIFPDILYLILYS